MAGLPEHAPVDRHYDGATGPTFTYRWGALTTRTSPLNYDVAIGVVGAVVLSLVGLVFIVGGIRVRGSYHAWWLPVGIGVSLVTMVLGFLLTRSKLEVRNAPIERLIRVHYDAGVIEFCFCPFNTGFVRKEVIDSYLCPLEELRAFDFTRNTHTPRPSASMRVWTSRGYLNVNGEPMRLKGLMDAMTIVAGHRAPPVFERSWVIGVAIFGVAGVLIAIAYYLNLL